MEGGGSEKEVGRKKRWKEGRKKRWKEGKKEEKKERNEGRE